MDKIINADLIDLNLLAVDKESVLASMAGMLENIGRLNNKEEFIKVVMEREKIASTHIGYGIGIPHGKSDTVKIPTVAFGRSEDGIIWEEAESQPVNLIFLIAVPEEAASNKHLKILSNLTRKLVDEDFRQKLMDTRDKGVLIQLLEETLSLTEAI